MLRSSIVPRSSLPFPTAGDLRFIVQRSVKDIEDNTIVLGIPTKVLRKIKSLKEVIYKLWKNMTI